MRILGILITLIGIATLLVSCGMDTSVETNSGNRVMNLHLISRQASLERWGFGLTILGVVMVGVFRPKPKTPPPDPTASPPQWLSSDRDRH